MTGSQASPVWIESWGCALQPPDGNDDPELTGAILRQTIRMSIGGQRARLRLSNEYGETALEIGAAAVGLPRDGRAGAGAIEPGSSVPLSFGSSSSVLIPSGDCATSDECDIGGAVQPIIGHRMVGSGTNLTVTMRLAARHPIVGPTTHPGSRTTSHVVPAEAVPTDREAAELVAQTQLPGAVPVEHWYLLAALQVRSYGLASPRAGREPAVAVLLGDSLTDGRGSTIDGNDRWSDLLVDRLHEREGLTYVAVVNQAAGGNRVLRDGLGISALRRLDRDVLACAGVRWLIVFEGVNDIGTAEATPRAQQRIGDELLAGYEEIIDRAHARDIRVYGATITPFGGHDYDDRAGLRERTRQRVNAWIRGGGRFDAVLDFNRAVRDPRHHRLVRTSLHTGDGLHLNPAGYRAIADAVPAELFGPA